MNGLTFMHVAELAARGAVINSCAGIELNGRHVGYPYDGVGPEHSGVLCPLPGVRAAREVYELDMDGEPTGRSVWLPLNF